MANQTIQLGEVYVGPDRQNIQLGEVYIGPEPGVTRLAPVEITGKRGWVVRDLLLYVAGPPVSGPLGGYGFRVIIEDNGKTLTDNFMGAPDELGRVAAADVQLNPKGGYLVVAGVWQGTYDRANTSITPFIYGRCHYAANTSGASLVFKVDPVIAQVSTDTSGQQSAKTTVLPGSKIAGEIQLAPAGVGFKIGGDDTGPSTQYMNGDSQSQTVTVTSVTGLAVSQAGS